MQRVNDDMDDLYRKAAENYPLNTDTSDWEKLRKKLTENSDEVVAVPGRNRNFKALILLLLLIPAGFISYKYLGQGSSNKPVKKQDAVNLVVNKNAEVSNDKTATADNAADKTPLNPSSLTAEDPVKQQPLQHSLHRANKGSLLVNTSRSTPVVTEQPTYVEPDQTKAAVMPATEGIQSQPDLPLKNELPHTPYSNNTENNNGENKSVEEKKDEVHVDKSSDKPVRKIVKERSFYAGILVAPDVSMVKFQPVKNTGINVGVLLGYRINKKLSVESGVMSDKKYYYSEGKYFNTSKLNLPGTAKISMVNGNCRMIEVPLNLRYSFRSSGKLNLFTTAGLSSYFMKEENYDYTIAYSSGQPYQRSSTYKNATAQLFCVANVSAGFEHRLSATTAIRFEPYVKIPLKGIGIGSLPITSTGVNIGITKKLF